MASEEERAAILAQYYGEGVDDEEEEPEWDGDESSSSSSSSGSGDESDDAGDCVVLMGSIHLSEEGRVIYSGTWCMRSELAAESTDAGRRRPKFKLKSQDVYRPPPPPTADNGDKNNNGDMNNDGEKNDRRELFDVRRPTLPRLWPPNKVLDSDDAELPTRRTMMFDGFFFEVATAASALGSAPPPPVKENGRHRHHPHGRKVKERDVEVFFVRGEDAAGADVYHISGRGQNDHGPFVLDGKYTPPSNDDRRGGDGDEGGGGATKDAGRGGRPPAGAGAMCDKRYSAGGATKPTCSAGGAAAAAVGGRSRGSKRSRGEDDDSFDDDFDDRTDLGEVAGLCEDGLLSVEELRRKYYGPVEDLDEVDGGGKDGGPGGTCEGPAKRPRVFEESEDDDECGF